jgi:hypothetical protein
MHTHRPKRAAERPSIGFVICALGDTAVLEPEMSKQGIAVSHSQDALSSPLKGPDLRLPDAEDGCIL